jgi:3-(methylthio)propionyl---CoA ligase
MLGLMQDVPLLISSLIRHADRHHGTVEIVSRRAEGGLHRCTYRELHARARRLANALDALGVGMSDRVALLAWNGDRVMELCYAATGKGAVLHAIDPQLASERIAWLANHAEDACLFFDPAFLPLVESIAAQCRTVKAFVLLTDRAQMPVATTIPGLLCYEELLAAQDDGYAWPQFDEKLASSLCYAPDAAGNLRGVLHSHRSTLLHAFAIAWPDAMNLSARDTILAAVPMSDANARGIPYAAAMIGAKLVLPGAVPDAKALRELIDAEGVTVSAAVAAPEMTTVSPPGASRAPRAPGAPRPREVLDDGKTRQARAPYGIDFRIVGADGRELPWDGRAAGELMLRGPWTVAGYFRGDRGDPLVADADDVQWLPTGDVATIDGDGCMRITGRGAA